MTNFDIYFYLSGALKSVECLIWEFAIAVVVIFERAHNAG
jgi:hypothetical protein